MHPYVHSDIKHNTQDLETAQVTKSRWAGKKAVDIYTMEYYLAVKKKKILPFAIA